jgi:ADP-ribose pyrophosphatase
MSNRKSIPQDAKLVFKGEIFEVWQWEQKMFDGSVATFERLKRPDTVQVITVVGDRILIQQQEQPDSAQPFVSLPGGRGDDGEEPLEAAKRELLEESGYVSDDWTLWKEDSPVGKIEWTIYTFIARNCRKESEPHLDGGEKITSRLVSFEEFLQLPDDPSFRDFELIVRFLRMRLDPGLKEEFRVQVFGS